MILLDANILLRALTWSEEPAIQKLCLIADALMRQAERNEVQLTASDAVLSEVAFILTAQSHYGLPVPDAAARMATIVNLPGFKRRDKRSILHSLDLWASRPQLGFVDSLTATQALQPGFELATFDSDFDPLPGINRWRPPDSNLEPV